MKKLNEQQFDNLMRDVFDSRPHSGSKFARMGPGTYADLMEMKRQWDLIRANRFNPISKWFWVGLYRHTLGNVVYWFGCKFLDW